jgi:hypothetical protein
LPLAFPVLDPPPLACWPWSTFSIPISLPCCRSVPSPSPLLYPCHLPLNWSEYILIQIISSTKLILTFCWAILSVGVECNSILLHNIPCAWILHLLKSGSGNNNHTIGFLIIYYKPCS